MTALGLPSQADRSTSDLTESDIEHRVFWLKLDDSPRP
jgi:hypothetical protein